MAKEKSLESIIVQAFTADLMAQGHEPDLNFTLPDGRKTIAAWLKSPTAFVPNINYQEFLKFQPTDNPIYPWIVFIK